MDKTQCENYLWDICLLLKEKALEAKQTKDAISNIDKRDYEIGHLMAYHEVTSLLQEQALAFNISLEEIGLADFDPEKELI